MDFIVGLPRTQTQNDVIWVIMDKLTKLAHFLTIHSTFSLEFEVGDMVFLKVAHWKGVIQFQK